MKLFKWHRLQPVNSLCSNPAYLGQYPSMQSLRPIFTMIDPSWLRETVEARGFRLVHEARRPLASGKAFWMGIFARAC